MEILTTISSLLSIGDLFATLTEKFRNSSNKEQVIAWLKELADLTESIADDLQQKQYPHSKCAQMNFYLLSFYDMLSKELSTEHKEHLFRLIHEAYQVERLLGQLNNLSDNETLINLTKMREASGVFRGMSDYLRLKK